MQHSSAVHKTLQPSPAPIPATNPNMHPCTCAPNPTHLLSLQPTQIYTPIQNSLGNIHPNTIFIGQYTAQYNIHKAWWEQWGCLFFCEIAPKLIYCVNTAAAFFWHVNWLQIRFIEEILTKCSKYIELIYVFSSQFKNRKAKITGHKIWAQRLINAMSCNICHCHLSEEIYSCFLLY